MSKNFVLIGSGGYIAPRHLAAIKDTGNMLLASCDLHDSVGILDKYFPESEFYLNLNDFSDYIDSQKKRGTKIDYLVVCSPNDLHYSHIEFGLSRGIDVICEKPLVLDHTQLSKLKKLELKFNARVFSILQLRLHQEITRLKEKINVKKGKINAELTYITSRGKWYMASWKGDQKRSGGLLMNIGVHFFDMLIYLFGNVKNIDVSYNIKDKAKGKFCLEHADIDWFLSCDENDLPENFIDGDKKTYRSIKIGETEVEFSSGFDDLHKVSYEEILNGNGFGIDDCRETLRAVNEVMSFNRIIEE